MFAVEERKLQAFLGLVRRAGKIVYGKELVRDYLGKKQAKKLLLVASDASGEVKSDWCKRSQSHGATCIILNNTDRSALGNAVGKEMLSVVAIADEGFADQILKLVTKAGGDLIAKD